MCNRDRKYRHHESTIVGGMVTSRVRVYYDIIPLDAGIIRKRTDAWYEKYMGDSLTEPDTDSVFMTRGIDFLGIEDDSDSASVSSSYSEKACGCGDETGLCGPPL